MRGFGGQAETASPFLGVKEMGGCRWAVHGGAGKQWSRENTVKKSCVLNTKEIETKKSGLHLLSLLAMNLSSEHTKGNKEGVRTETFSTATPCSKVSFCLVGSSVSS